MYRATLFYSGLVLALVLMFVVPSLFYVMAGRANLEWTIAGLLSSNVPSIAGTLLICLLIVFRQHIMGAPGKQ